MDPVMEKALEQLQDLYKDLDKEIGELQKQSGLHCPPGCGFCCQRPTREIEATILEMIPAALALIEEGQGSFFRDRAQEAGEAGRCVFYSPINEATFSGTCGRYTFRPLVCRLFGFGAIKNKQGKLEISYSIVMKKTLATVLDSTDKKLTEGMMAPLYSDYGTRLRGIDSPWTQDSYPLNLALQKALEWVFLRQRYS